METSIRNVIGAYPSPKFRQDIQALRGLAIVMVLLYHAKLPWISAGYLGVDVFLVISGYLMTSLIRDGINLDTLTFRGFYFRRAKRLLPAAYATFFLTVIASHFFLTVPEMKDFFNQLIGAVTLTANVVLRRQTGYFEGEAELKPLLHTWSLSLEEQYYLLIPAFMKGVPRRYWSWGFVAALVASLGSAVYLSGRDNAGSFYLLPFRAWELMIGSLGALVVVENRILRWLRILFWPAAAGLIVLAIRPLRLGSFDVGTLLICLSTLIVVLRHHKAAANNRVAFFLGKIGDMSYSLYLVHWPLFAFFNNAWVDGIDQQTIGIRLGLIGLSFVVGYALYRLIENPVHKSKNISPARFVTLLTACSLLLVTFAAWIAKSPKNVKDYAAMRSANIGFDPECVYKYGFKPLAVCRNDEHPEILVWGDSFAMHLVLAIADSAKTVQATKSGCGPLLNLAQHDPASEKGQQWSRDCMEFNDDVLEYLKSTPSIKTVVMSSRWGYYLEKVENSGYLLKRTSQNKYDVLPVGGDVTLEAVKNTVHRIRALGKKVVVVAPPPGERFDVARCLERRDTGLLIFSRDHRDCELSVSKYHKYRRPVLDLLSEFPSRADVNVVDFDSALCSENTCDTVIDDVFVYGKGMHLSVEGSRLLAKKMGLVEKIRDQAR